MQQRNFARGHDDPPLAVGGPAQVHLHEWSAVTYNVQPIMILNTATLFEAI